MSWYYPETRPRRLPLTTPVRPAASGGGGGPPTGPAGGDLAGSYPNPTLAPGAVGTTDLVDGAVTDAKITSVAYGKVTGAPAIPTTLPPSGPASGDLTGTYPGPTIGALKVTDAKINDVGATKLTGTIAQARLPVAPAGLLTANVNDAQITDAKIVGLAYGKLTGAPTSLPPSGAASGDLTGTYPGPTVAAATISAPKLSPAPVAGDVGKMVTVGAGPALTYTVVPTALPPSGAAGGDLAGSTYPNPVVAAGAITDAKIAGVAYSKVTGAPTSLPPSGVASGSLAGSYPAPSIAASAVRGTPSSGGTAREIQKASIWGGDDLIDLSVPDAKISGLAYTKLSGAPTALPPSGAAGGDLAGAYPNPTIGALKVVTGSLAALAVTDAKVNDVAWGKITGAPSSLPPSGAAGGDLAGTYPNPTIGALKVTTGSIAALAVTDAKINDVAYSKVTGHPSSYPPSGAASGDLGGTYPGPTVAKLNGLALTAGDTYYVSATPALARLAANSTATNQFLRSVSSGVPSWAQVAYADVSGTPASLPPSGTAGGDLVGTYPNPLVDGINGAAVGVTTPLARGDLLVANATPALVRLARGTVNQVLQSNGTDVIWGPAPATGGPPTGTAGGSLTGSYPNPTLTTTGVTAGTYGTQYKVAQVTVTAEGRITAVVEVTVRARWG